MNIGEFIIKIGTQGDTKALDEATKKMEEAEKKSRRLLEYLKKLKEATSEYEKRLIKKNFAQQVELDNLKNIDKKQKDLNRSMANGINTALKMTAAIGATVVALDRMGNSLLKSNQMYMTFQRQTDMSIGRLNRMAGLAQLSGMNLSPEQVAGDLQSLKQKIFRLGLTGEGAGIFAQLGMNPIGMKPDQFIAHLRQRTKGYTGEQKSYILSELGLSQEWLNVLDLTDEKFQDYLKTANELQLKEEERVLLAKYVEKQQKNNMRWELAKQRLLIAIMPMVQEIMEVTSKIALKVSNVLEQNPKWLPLVKDILLLLAGNAIIRNITSLFNMFKGIGATLAALGIGGAVGKTGMATKGLLGTTGFMGLRKLAQTKGLGAVAGVLGKRAAAGVGALAGGPVGAIFSIAMAVWTIVDIFNLFVKKDEEKDNEPPVDTSTERYSYQKINSNMTNNFYNNPQPVKEAAREMSTLYSQLVAAKGM